MIYKKSETQNIRKMFMYLAFMATIVLSAIGGLAFWAYSFTGAMVKDELTAQKIYFPEKGNAAFDPTTYPDLQQYAGQLVDTPTEAKAYANGFIGRHLHKIANGKVYAEVSAEAMKNPSDQTLQQQKQTLFQGETLRTMLLTSGYGFGMIGKIAKVTSYIAFAFSVLALGIALVLRRGLSN